MHADTSEATPDGDWVCETGGGRNAGLAHLLVLALIAVAFAGCAGSGGSSPSPVEPGLSRTDTHRSVGNRVLWGLWQFRVDMRSPKIDIVPLRTGLAHVNALRLAEPVPLKYLTYDEDTLVVDYPKGLLDVDIVLTHPLPGYPEFTGFDVRGVFISDGTRGGLSLDDSLSFPKVEESRLLNADGYTRWWNPREFTGVGLLGYHDGWLGVADSLMHYRSTINGFKCFADGLGASDPVMQPIVLQGRGRFSCSSMNRRHYSIDFGPKIPDFMVFNYAVDAGWEKPANMPPQTFDDFPVSANSLEPFNIDVRADINSLYYDPDLEDCPFSGGVLRLSIDVATWQGAEGISQVLVGSPDLGVDFFPAMEISGTEVYSARVSTFTAELAPDLFEKRYPQVIIAASCPLGSYETGPENVPITFQGPPNAQLTLYDVYIPEVGMNSPPQVGPIIGPAEAVAGLNYYYEVEDYFDCQDFNYDLEFAWEIGDDAPSKYDDGYGTTDGLYQTGNGGIYIRFPDEGLYRIDVRVRDLDGMWGYTTHPRTVEVSLPPPPEWPDEGVNLELSLKRTALRSYEYVFDPSDIPAIQLKWDGSGVTGMVTEWAVYRDDNPYDEVVDWQEVGTTERDVTEFSNYLVGPNAYHSGAAYYYTVKARAVSGNRKSEGPGSTELAFIELENAEPDGAPQDQHPWSMGYGGMESSFFRQWERPGYGGAVAGGCWMMDPDSPYMRRHLWSVIASPELPILTDPVLAATTQEWYIELIFGGQVTPMNECWDNYARMSVGTVPDDPSTHNGQAYYYAYNEARPQDYMDGSRYFTQGYWSSNNSRFDETPATYNDRYGWGKEEYGWPFLWARFRLADLNPNGAGRVRAAIGFGSGATTDSLARPRADEIAVIVY